MSKIIKDFLKGFSKEELQAMEQAISENREEFLGVVQEKVEKKEDNSDVQQESKVENSTAVEKTKDTAQNTNVETQKKTDSESEAERIARIVALTIKEMGILPKTQEATIQNKKEEDGKSKDTQKTEETKQKTPNIGMQKQPEEKIGEGSSSFLNAYLKRN